MELNCPLPFEDDERITMAHGGGGRRMEQLIREVILPHFPTGGLKNDHDGVVINGLTGELAFTTDSYVVTPQFFPGGNIGDLAVNGTINDLAMCGARPAYLSCAFILEEGFAMESFRQILVTMGKAAAAAGVNLVTGDTKVVDSGKGDGIFINTAGIGQLLPGARIGPERVAAGDAVIINGTVADHGMTIMAEREHLNFESGRMESDTRPLHREVAAIIDEFGAQIHCLRDMTRGGLASVLNEIAQSANVQVTLEDSKVPVNDPVQGACELLGLDPLYVANEGKFAIFAPEELGTEIVKLLKAVSPENTPAVVGKVAAGEPPRVECINEFGSRRILDLLSGDQLPRIC